MKKKMTRREVTDLFQAIQGCSDVKSKKMAYALGRNIEKLKPVIKELQKQQKPTDDFQEFLDAKKKLLEKHQEEDENGSPKVRKNSLGQEEFCLKDPVKWKTEFNKLKKKHKAAIDAQEKSQQEFDDLLDEEEEFELYWVKMDWVPDDIEVGRIIGIMPLIEEEDME